MVLPGPLGLVVWLTFAFLSSDWYKGLPLSGCPPLFFTIEVNVST